MSEVNKFIGLEYEGLENTKLTAEAKDKMMKIFDKYRADIIARKEELLRALPLSGSFDEFADRFKESVPNAAALLEIIKPKPGSENTNFVELRQMFIDYLEIIK